MKRHRLTDFSKENLKMKELEKTNEAKPNDKVNPKAKKKYQKPHIVHTKIIETLAGSCNGSIGCNPNY